MRLPILPDNKREEELPEDEVLIRQWKRESDYMGRLSNLPLATLGIIVLLTFMHFLVLQFADNDPERALYYILVAGAKVNLLIAHGEWWRLLAAAFLHVSFVHLSVSCIGMLLLGWFVENTMGRRVVLLVFMVSGAVGSLLSFWLSSVPSVGASGAMFGMLGATMGYSLQRWNAIPRFIRSYVVGLPATIGIVSVIYGLFAGNVDNFSHLGGTIAGFVIGLVVPGLQERPNWATNLFSQLVQAAAVVTLILTLGAVWSHLNLRFDTPRWPLESTRTPDQKAYVYPEQWPRGVFSEGSCNIGQEVQDKDDIACFVDPFFSMYLVASTDRLEGTPLYADVVKAREQGEPATSYGPDRVLWGTDPLRRLDFAFLVFEPLTNHYLPLFAALQSNPELAPATAQTPDQ